MRQENREIKEFNKIIEVMKSYDVCRLALNDGGYSAFEGYKVDKTT